MVNVELDNSMKRQNNILTDNALLFHRLFIKVLLHRKKEITGRKIKITFQIFFSFRRF